MKENVLIYHLTESLFKIIDFWVTFILLKSCDKMWLALDCAHHISVVMGQCSEQVTQEKKF